MFANTRLTLTFSVCLFVFVSTSNVDAQNNGFDNRREYVRSSSPTKSGNRVVSESVGGQQMVRIARASGNPTPAPRTADLEREAESNREAIANRTSNANNSTYSYPEPIQAQQTTAFRQAANQAPQLRYAPNRVAQCNCNGVPAPPQQLQFAPQNFGNGFFQAQQNFGLQQQAFQQPSFQPQQGFGFTGQQQAFQPQQGFGFGGLGNGFSNQTGIGVPQFNQTGGNWWTPFITGSGYYTPLLNFRNLPPGSYLGQGLVGQATAYVDGQPVRNLLRYISP